VFLRRLTWTAVFALGSQLAATDVRTAAEAPAAANGPVATRIVVDDARLRQLLPGQHKTAGYFNITNTSAAPVSLTGASSSIAKAIEFHRIVHDGDIVRMRPVEKVMVAAGATVRFEPGGLHLMVFGVKELPERTEIVLATATGERIAAVFRQVPLGVE
jgi:copper(I)-binding protein